MKKFIPIFSLAIASVCLQNCVHRDEDTDSKSGSYDEIQTTIMLRQDSAQSSEETLYPDPTDPPVRDGDNWRHVLDQ